MNGNLVVLTAICITLVISGCGSNSLQAKDEAANNSWAALNSSYRKRAWLVPYYLKIVGEHVQPEAVILGEVASAAEEALRSGVRKSPPTVQDEFRRYRAVQDDLTRALARLAVVETDYPRLVSDPRFEEMLNELAMCETRINSARSGYFLAVHDFNVTKRVFPHALANLLFYHYGDKEGVSMENNVQLAGEGSHQRAAMVMP